MTPNKLTLKQQRFVDGKLAGMGNAAAALAAGYSRNGLDVAAANLAKHPSIKKAIAAAKKQHLPRTDAGKRRQSADEPAAVLRSNYKDSLEFMIDSMNNAKLPVGVRFEAAKTLLPYQHARIGEKGKKDSAVDRAKDVSKGKYAAQTAPTNVTPIKRA